MLSVIHIGGCDLHEQQHRQNHINDREHHIVDDILDVTSDSETLGKPVGSDKENGKSTYVSLLGLEKSAELADKLTKEAKSALDIFGDEGEFLSKLADKLLEREN